MKSSPRRKVSRVGQRVRRATALIASLGLAFMGAFVAFQPAAEAADPRVVDKVADPASYHQFPGSADAAQFYAASRFPGRIWTDKSVFDHDVLLTPPSGGGGSTTVSVGDNELAVALSAIGSTRHITGEEKAPIDLVLILDNSLSMTQCVTSNAYCNTAATYTNSRAYAMTQAVDIALNVVMDANPENRVALVQFGSSSGILTPLGTPQRIAGVDQNGDGRDDFISISHGYNNRMTITTAANQMTVGYAGSTGQATNIQLGMFRGMSILAGQSTASVSGASQRIPNVLFFSDGEPTLSANAEEWWDIPNDSGTQGPTTAGGAFWGNGYKATMTASYLKAKVTDTYNDEAYNASMNLPNIDAKVYTVGLGIDGLSDNGRTIARATLDPTEELDNASNPMAVRFADTYSTYQAGDPVTVPVNQNAGSNNNYTAIHPTGTDATYDPMNSADGIKYNEAFFAPVTAEDLIEVFKQIASQIVSAAPQYPVEIEDDSATTSGYVTFTDPLGAFMQVSEISNLSFCSTLQGSIDPNACTLVVFSNPTQQQSEPGVWKYTFSGKYAANHVYGEANVSDLIVTVHKSASLARGDEVIVQVPASLLPVSDSQITLDDEGDPLEMLQYVSHPLHLFYKVAPKPGVIENLANPTALNTQTSQDGTALAEYIQTHTTNGKVRFYSNDYSVTTSSGASTIEAKTVASFQPDSENDFYRIARDTILYTNSALTDPITKAEWDGMDASETVYYPVTEYVYDGPATDDVAERIFPAMNTKQEIVDGEDDTHKLFVKDGVMMAPAGMYNVTQPHSLDHPKCENLAWVEDYPVCSEATPDSVPGNHTETAQYARMSAYSHGVTASILGNNGYVSYDVPGTLTVRKTVQAANGLNPSEDTVFSFVGVLTDDTGKELTESFPYSVYEQSDTTTPVRSGTISSGDTLELTGTQQATLIGLPNGTQFEITESNLPAGYTLTSSNGTTGTIDVEGTPAVADFVNTYSPAPVILSTGPTASKVLDGRDWLATDTFTAELCPVGQGACEQVDFVPDAARHGSLTFTPRAYTSPGTYTYTISEIDTQIPSVSYSGALYRWTVTVRDDGSGQLTATSVLVRLIDDEGISLPSPAAVAEAQFTNSFSTTDITAQMVATKMVEDLSTGATRPPQHEYRFSMELLGADLDNPTAVAPASMPTFAGDQDGDGRVTVHNEGSQVTSPAIHWTADHVGHSWFFRASEIDDGIAGVEYSTAVWFWRIEADSTTGDITLASTHCSTTADQITVNAPYGSCDPVSNAGSYTYVDHADREFLNRYAPQPVTADLLGTKTLDGRPWLTTDSFTFTLTPNDQVTTDAIASGGIVVPQASTSATVGSGDQTNGVAGFSFPGLTFTSQGSYQFAVRETIPNPGAYGMTYDGRTFIYEVVISDPGVDGELDAAVTVRGNVPTDTSADFVNRYRATNQFGGVDVMKSLTGRPLHMGEFTFTVTASDQESCAKAQFDPGTCSVLVTNGFGGSDPTMTNLPGEFNFTQADLGKVFHYIIAEQQGSLGGITYDPTVYDTTLTPLLDEATGRLYVVTAFSVGGGQVSSFDSRDGGTPTVSFANTYAANPVVAEPQFTKTLANRAWQSTDAFDFTITAVTPSAPMPPQTTVTVSSAQEGAGFGFGQITYTRIGVYVYSVAEVIPDPPAGGMEYDSMPSTVTVAVSDPGTGNLQAVVFYDGNEDFVNHYRASFGWGLDLSKTLNGRDMEAGEFTFLVKPHDQAAADAGGIPLQGIEVVNAGAQTDGTPDVTSVLSGSQEFNESQDGQTFCYDVSEVVPTPVGAGLIYDQQVYTACASISDDAQGVLTVTTVVTDSDGNTVDTWTNTSADSGDVQWPTVEFVNEYENPTWTLEKTSDPASGSTVAPGSVITYSVTATPEQGRTVPSVTVTDDLSGVLSYATIGAITPPGNTVAIVSGSTLTWTIGDLSQPLTLTYEVTVNADAWDVTLVNSVTGDGGDPTDPGDPDSPGEIPPSTCTPDEPCTTEHETVETPTWDLVKTSDPASGSTVEPGSTITYSVTATPEQGRTVPSVTVTDDLSDVLEHASLGQITAPAGTTTTLNGTTLTWVIGDLSQPLTLTYEVTVNADAWDVTLVNAVTGAGGDPDGPDGPGEIPPTTCTPDEPCTTEHETVETPTWDLAKTSDPVSGSTVEPGSVITYSVTATPEQGRTVPSVTVTDDLSGVMDHGVVGGFVAPAGTTTSLSGSTLTWVIGDLDKQMVLTYEVTVDADAWDVTLVNAVTGAGGDPDDPTGPGEIPPTTCIPDEPCTTEHETVESPTWDLVKTSDPVSGSTVDPGSVITYSVTATPEQGRTVPNVTVTDDLSGVMSHALVTRITAPAGTTTDLNGTTLTWVVGDLSAPLTLTYEVTVKADAWDVTLVNAVTGDGGDPTDPGDPDSPGEIPPTSCTPDEPCTTEHETVETPTWDLVKTSDPVSGSTVEPGSTITYSVTATPEQGRTVPSVTVTDDLSGVMDHGVVGTVTAPAGTTTSLSGTILTWVVGDLSAPLTLTYEVTVKADAWDVTLVNAVTGAGGDPDDPTGPGEIPPTTCTPDEPCTTEHETVETPTWDLVKTADPASGSKVAPGSVITYLVTATPEQGRMVPSVTVTDDLSEVMSHGAVGRIVAPGGTTATLNGTTLTWVIGDLSQPVTLAYEVTIFADAWNVTLVNSVTGEGGDPDDPDGPGVIPPTTCAIGDPCSTSHTTLEKPGDKPSILTGGRTQPTSLVGVAALGLIALGCVGALWRWRKTSVGK